MPDLNIVESYSAKGVENAAILLLSLQSDASAKILKHMSEQEVDTIIHAMARLGKVSADRTEEVLQSFFNAYATRSKSVGGSMESVRTILMEAFGRDQAGRLVERLTKALEQDGADFNHLRRVDPQQLANFIQDEHPQTIALILSHLDPTQAAAVIAVLPAKIRVDIVTRMAALERISPESVRTIASVIRQKLRNLGELSREACGGVRAVADMFNRLDAETSNHLLTSLQEHDAALFDNVRRFMFVFEDLQVLDELSVRELLERVDRRVLVVALKSSSEELRKHLTKGLSQRGAEMLQQDIESLGPVRIKDVDDAQQQIILKARQLEQEGIISLQSSNKNMYIN